VLLSVGNKVSYPCQGPCLVAADVKRHVDGKLTEFHHLIVLNDRGGELYVPIDKVPAGGIRRLLERSEIPRLLDHLKKASRPAENWKQRNTENLKLFASGSAFDLAEIVDSLSELKETRVLSPSDRQTLERARKLLVCEISEVTGETKSAAEEKIDKALEPKRPIKKPGRKQREIGLK
jgi:RNA polymerase-interacting CarD/CdnL/TRCF family regulator